MTAARSRPTPQWRSPRPTRIEGWLADGTPRFAPIGAVLIDGDRVCCHLCGNWYLSVTPHLPAHGWTKGEYLAAFGLELGNSLSGEATHKRRAAALIARQASDPAIRAAQRAARRRARSGELAAAASQAATGRPHPAERRKKTIAALSAVDPAARSAANVRRGRTRIDEIAATIASTFEYSTFADYLSDQWGSGTTLAELSRTAGLHKDWMSRHVPSLVPDTERIRRTDPRDRRWQSVLDQTGMADVATFLHVRHEIQHCTVSAIASESGLARSSVESAMNRYGIQRTAHARTRNEAARRSERIARSLGFDGLENYITHRRNEGVTWKAMAAECRIPPTTLRRATARAAARLFAG